ncbi:hypothetical protein JN757_14615 [Pseudomonas granadensis]|uniref:Amidase domain-containing protein n=1 Tax=Pseudomonas granadensis TaxID=1421430 RepID=A0ABX7G930_9PSED|nr:hypothetical protein JN757_14615 [Pseudomonas granadensis]
MGQSSVGRQFNSVSASTNQWFTEAVSHTGYPAIFVPAGFTSKGLPVGMQIAEPHGRDDAVLNAAAVFEQVAPWAAARSRL